MITDLHWDKLNAAMVEYNEEKCIRSNAYICRCLWFYRIYTGDILLFFVFLVALLLWPGIIRWFIDWFMVDNYVKDYNSKLDLHLYNKYK